MGYVRGTSVERDLEGLWLAAKVLRPTPGSEAAYDIVFCDDGALEAAVPSDELRACEESDAHSKVPLEQLPPEDAAEAPEGDAPITDSAGDAVIISGADEAAREQEEKALKSMSEDAAARAEREKDTVHALMTTANRAEEADKKYEEKKKS